MDGIDISHYQETMNWDKTKATGIRFAILKASQGLTADKMFKVNSASCPMEYKGAYHYLDYTKLHYKLGEEEIFGTKQAQFFLQQISGWKHNMVGFLDIENNTYWEALSANYSRAKKIALAFKKEYEKQTGHKLGVYMNLSTTGAKEWTGLKYEYVWRDFTDGPLWMAQYNATMSLPYCWNKWHIWQKTDKANGALYGAGSASIDLNVANPNTFGEVVTDDVVIEVPLPTPIPGEKLVKVMVVVTQGLRIRTTPQKVDWNMTGQSLSAGEVVEDMEEVTDGIYTWGRIGHKQWACIKEGNTDHMI